MMLNGEKFKTARLSVSYRTSKAVEVDNEFLKWAMSNGEQYLRYKEPEVDKTAVKEALEKGEVPHAALVERVSVTIK
jgi:hypothetical protein